MTPPTPASSLVFDVQHRTRNGELLPAHVCRHAGAVEVQLPRGNRLETVRHGVGDILVKGKNSVFAIRGVSAQRADITRPALGAVRESVSADFAALGITAKQIKVLQNLVSSYRHNMMRSDKAKSSTIPSSTVGVGKDEQKRICDLTQEECKVVLRNAVNLWNELANDLHPSRTKDWLRRGYLRMHITKEIQRLTKRRNELQKIAAEHEPYQTSLAGIRTAVQKLVSDGEGEIYISPSEARRKVEKCRRQIQGIGTKINRLREASMQKPINMKDPAVATVYEANKKAIESKVEYLPEGFPPNTGVRVAAVIGAIETVCTRVRRLEREAAAEAERDRVTTPGSDVAPAAEPQST